MHIDTLLRRAIELDASDLHLRAGTPPILRIHGILQPQKDWKPLTSEDTMQAFEDIASEQRKRTFAKQKELDFSYSIWEAGRFRVNASIQRGSISLAFRRISIEIPTIDELNLPAVCKTFALRRRGLVLVTGPTGSGKSTTLASMIEHLNKLDSRLIVTIEDPIEYLYEDHHCVITQREVGSDTSSFASALKHSLRQDVDVILVGEMRDLETIEACLTAAETGHLVLSTLHTSSAPMTIDRIVDAFPPHQQSQVRMQLSLTLAGVISQFLLPRRDEEGRIPAVEVMIANSAVRNLIREGKTHQLPNVIQTRGNEGMQSMEQALKELYIKGMISQEDATATANDPDNLHTLMSNG